MIGWLCDVLIGMPCPLSPYHDAYRAQGLPCEWCQYHDRVRWHPIRRKWAS